MYVCNIPFARYNERRYSFPWAAVVTAWPVGGRPVLDFRSRYVGRHGDAGRVEFSAAPGDLVTSGQKDYRNPRESRRDWWVVEDDGRLRNLPGGEVEARDYWLDRAAAVEQTAG